jgi:hypothetical protein
MLTCIWQIWSKRTPKLIPPFATLHGLDVAYTGQMMANSDQNAAILVRHGNKADKKAICTNNTSYLLVTSIGSSRE